MFIKTLWEHYFIILVLKNEIIYKTFLFIMDIVHCFLVLIAILSFIYFLIDVKIIDYLDKEGWGKLIVLILVLTIILWIVSMLYSCTSEPYMDDIIEYEQYLNDRVK